MMCALHADGDLLEDAAFKEVLFVLVVFYKSRGVMLLAVVSLIFKHFTCVCVPKVPGGPAGSMKWLVESLSQNIAAGNRHLNAGELLVCVLFFCFFVCFCIKLKR
jgi:hypothetical protein